MHALRVPSVATRRGATLPAEHVRNCQCVSAAALHSPPPHRPPPLAHASRVAAASVPGRRGRVAAAAAPAVLPLRRSSCCGLVAASRSARRRRPPPATAAAADAAPAPQRSNLRAEDFRHPLDEQNTQLLQLLPALPALTKAVLAPVAEEALMLQHTGASVLVGPTQLPWLHRLTLEAAATLGLSAPSVYVRQAATPNAFTLAVNGRKPALVLHTALIELLTETELQAVIGHELGHLACDHGVWLTLAAALAAPAGSLPGVPAFVAESASEALARWARAAELSCDRAAALVARDPSVVVSVLMKLAGGTPRLAGQLNAEAFLAQARAYDAAAAGSPLGWALAAQQLRGATHPLPVARAAEVDRWARSEQYRQLLRRLPLHSPWPRPQPGAPH